MYFPISSLTLCLFLAIAVENSLTCSHLPAPEHGRWNSSSCYNDEVVSSTSCTLSCDVGYTVKRGTSVVSCQEDGQFSSVVFPVCQQVSCGSLPIPRHGMWSHLECYAEEVLYGTECKLRCYHGYNVSGDGDGLICAENGLFQPSHIPVCIAESIPCSSLPVPTHGQWNSSKCSTSGMLYPSTCQLRCDDGYAIMGTSSLLQCMQDGQFYPNEMPTCEEIISCGSLPTPLNGVWNATVCNTVNMTYPTVCNLVCNEGYFVNQESSIVMCQIDGEFRPSSFPLCEAKTSCGFLPTPKNAHWNSTDCNAAQIFYPTVCLLVCDDEMMTAAAAEHMIVTCGEDGFFRPSILPSCLAKIVCGPLPVPSNGRWSNRACSSSNLTYPSPACQLLCDDNYEYSGDSDIVLCGPNGIFVPELLPVCKAWSATTAVELDHQDNTTTTVETDYPENTTYSSRVLPDNFTVPQNETAEFFIFQKKLIKGMFRLKGFQRTALTYNPDLENPSSPYYKQLTKLVTPWFLSNCREVFDVPCESQCLKFWPGSVLVDFELVTIVEEPTNTTKQDERLQERLLTEKLFNSAFTVEFAYLRVGTIAVTVNSEGVPEPSTDEPNSEEACAPLDLCKLNCRTGLDVNENNCPICACKNDLCQDIECGENEFCQVMDSLCTDEKCRISVEPFPACVSKCPFNQEFQACTFASCLKTCFDLDQVSRRCPAQHEPCVAQCMCPDHLPYLSSSGLCVTTETCLQMIGEPGEFVCTFDDQHTCGMIQTSYKAKWSIIPYTGLEGRYYLGLSCEQHGMGSISIEDLPPAGSYCFSFWYRVGTHNFSYLVVEATHTDDRQVQLFAVKGDKFAEKDLKLWHQIKLSSSSKTKFLTISVMGQGHEIQHGEIAFDSIAVRPAPCFEGDFKSSKINQTVVIKNSVGFFGAAEPHQIFSSTTNVINNHKDRNSKLFVNKSDKPGGRGGALSLQLNRGDTLSHSCELLCLKILLLLCNYIFYI